MKPTPETIWMDVEFVRETEKARLFDTEHGEVWIPKSKKVTGAMKREGGQIVRIEVYRWFAKNEGWIDDKDEL